MGEHTDLSSVGVAELFDGARRQEAYGERLVHPSPAPSSLDEGDNMATRVKAPVATARAIEGRVVPSRDVPWSQTTASGGSARGLLRLLGIGRHRKQERREVETRQVECERIIRQSTWIRAVNIAVASTKGASGVTPAALMVGGLLGDIRGGGVAVFEATAERRGLLDVAEGSPVRGLRELLTGAGQVSSAGTLAGYTAPQTSHAAVIGSIGPRAQLSAEDLVVMRHLLDTYYTISVAALNHNLESELGLASLWSADAVVVPAVMSRRSLTGVVRTVQVIARHRPTLLGRVVVALGHSGAPEDPQTSPSGQAWLFEQLTGAAEQARSAQGPQVVSCPHEPAFIADGEFVLSEVTAASRAAWSDVTAQAVQRIDDSQPVVFEGE